MNRCFARALVPLLLLLLPGIAPQTGQAQSSAASPSAAKPFSPLDLWKAAVLRGDAPALKTMYSTTPSAQIDTPTGKADADADISFWTGMKARTITLKLLQSDSPAEGVRQLMFEAELHFAAPAKIRTLYVSEGQLWQQENGKWKLVAGKRTAPAQLEQPTSTKKNIYPAGVDAHAEIAEALAQAVKLHKRVLVVFGANWCFDCHVLDLALHRPDVEPTLKRSFEVVHVDVGEGDKNQDLMAKYEVPMSRGIPGVAVLDADGKLLYSQKNGEFEKARALAPADVLQFLDKWKPETR